MIREVVLDLPECAPDGLARVAFRQFAGGEQPQHALDRDRFGRSQEGRFEDAADLGLLEHQEPPAARR